MTASSEILTFGIQTPDGKLPSLEVAKALYEACQLAARQATAEQKEKFRVELLGMLRQHLETEKAGLDMLITGMCTGDTVNAQQEHLAAIALCIERLDYTPQPVR